jgi:hypothetical protein
MEHGHESAGEDESPPTPDPIIGVERRRSRGRRQNDEVVITPKSVALVGGVITIVLALFSPVFYVRDMAQQVREVTGAVEEMRRIQDTDRQSQGADHAAIIILQAEASQGISERRDHEQRIRELERTR